MTKSSYEYVNHHIYILTNSAHEVYIMVHRNQVTLEYLIDFANTCSEVEEKRNRVRNRFIRNSKDLKLERINTGKKFKNLRETLDYRDQIIEQYESDGYLVLDDKYYKELEKPAATNFGMVLNKLDIKAAVAKYGQDVLIAARKHMTVGEFLETYEV